MKKVYSESSLNNLLDITITCELKIFSLMFDYIPCIILLCGAVFNPLTIKKQRIGTFPVKCSVSIFTCFPSGVRCHEGKADRLETTYRQEITYKHRLTIFLRTISMQALRNIAIASIFLIRKVAKKITILKLIQSIFYQEISNFQGLNRTPFQ